MEDQMAQLTALVTRLAARINAGEAVPPAMKPPVTVPPQAPFTPPATTQLGTYPSLRSLFPEIEAAHITAIITHEFRGADLWKLDSRYPSALQTGQHLGFIWEDKPFHDVVLRENVKMDDEGNGRLTPIAKIESTRGHTKLLDVACQLWSSSIPMNN